MNQMFCSGASTDTAVANANGVKRKRKLNIPSGEDNERGLTLSQERNGQIVPYVAHPEADLDSHLVELSSAEQTVVQNEVLSLIFGNKTAHAPHLYRNLPGPQPISVTRSCLSTIQSHDYWVCEKSDGERAMLFISHKTMSAYLIDRKFLVRQLRDQPVYAELFAQHGDSLIDGELILAHGPFSVGQSPATFMAFDALYVDGQRFIEQKLSHRLGVIGQQVIKPYRLKFTPPEAIGHAISMPTTPDNSSGVPFSAPPLAICAKAFHRKHHIKHGVFDFIKLLGRELYEYNDGKRCNNNDGIIFTPEEDEYWCRHVPLLKWKWTGLNTIDFLVKRPWFDLDGRLMLYSTANTLADGARSQMALVHVRSTSLTVEKKKYFLDSISDQEKRLGGRSTSLETAIVEMQYDTHSSSWQPKTFRWDKSAPNFMTTVVATMETIIDNVTPNDLQRSCAKR